MEMELRRVNGESQKGVGALSCKRCDAENKAAKEAMAAFNRVGEGRQQALEKAAQSTGQDQEEGSAE